MTSEEFDAALDAVNMSRKHFARLIWALSDRVSLDTVTRRVQRFGRINPDTGTPTGHAVTAEAVTLLAVLKAYPAVLNDLRRHMVRGAAADGVRRIGAVDEAGAAGVGGAGGRLVS